MSRHFIVVIAAALACGAQGGLIDDFNRPNAPTLGSNWDDIEQGFRVWGSMATSPRTPGLARSRVFGSDLLSSQDLFLKVFAAPYWAIGQAGIAAYMDDSYDGIFAAVVDSEGDGLFDRAELRSGFQGSVLASEPLQPFVSGRITLGRAHWNPDRGFQFLVISDTGSFTSLVLGDDTGIDLGGGIGIGGRGNVSMDDFGYGIIPEPASMLCLGLGILALLRKRREQGQS